MLIAEGLLVRTTTIFSFPGNSREFWRIIENHHNLFFFFLIFWCPKNVPGSTVKYFKTNKYVYPRNYLVLRVRCKVLTIPVYIGSYCRQHFHHSLRTLYIYIKTHDADTLTLPTLPTLSSTLNSQLSTLSDDRGDQRPATIQRFTLTTHTLTTHTRTPHHLHTRRITYSSRN
jgi:hypothetical protein